MNRFSIKDIEVLTGIKSHTLRIWEQRYGIIEPKRTETNIRFYDNNDLRYLLNVSLLSKMGYKISKISKLKQDEIANLISDYSSSVSDSQDKLNLLVKCALELDEFTFEKVLSDEILENGITKTMINLVFPFLNHLGFLWSAGTLNPSYEHFVVSLIKTKLMVSIDKLGYGDVAKDKKRVLLFLPEGESHEIGLLFANFLFKYAGHHTIYLGQNLPCMEISPVIKNYKPDIVFTSMVSGYTVEEMKSMIVLLTDLCKHCEFLITGGCFLQANLKLPKRVFPVSSYESIKPYL